MLLNLSRIRVGDENFFKGVGFLNLIMSRGEDKVLMMTGDIISLDVTSYYQ